MIKLGIGDVTRPLPPACIQAFHRGVDEMADAKTFRGYGPEQGYGFLREKIAHHDFQTRGPILLRMKYLSAMAPSATTAISRKFFPKI